MAQIEITGIRKDNGNHENPHEAVEYYRWIQHGTDNAGITRRETVVDWLERGVNGVVVTAFVNKVNPKADCFVNVSGRGIKFLQSRADSTSDNNLLKLPEC